MVGSSFESEPLWNARYCGIDDNETKWNNIVCRRFDDASNGHNNIVISRFRRTRAQGRLPAAGSHPRSFIPGQMSEFRLVSFAIRNRRIVARIQSDRFDVLYYNRSWHYYCTLVFVFPYNNKIYNIVNNFFAFKRRMRIVSPFVIAVVIIIHNAIIIIMCGGARLKSMNNNI